MQKIISNVNESYEIIEDNMLNKIEYYSPFTESINIHYNDDLISGLYSDRIHYNQLIKYIKQFYTYIFEHNYDIFYCFGGGLPRFESHFNVSELPLP
jgi:hypothetical protein